MSTMLRLAVCKKLRLSATASQADIYRAALSKIGAFGRSMPAMPNKPYRQWTDSEKDSFWREWSSGGPIPDGGVPALPSDLREVYFQERSKYVRSEHKPRTVANIDSWGGRLVQVDSVDGEWAIVSFPGYDRDPKRIKKSDLRDIRQG